MPWSEWIQGAPDLGGGELPGGVLSAHRGEATGFAAAEDAVAAARTAATAGTAEASSDRVLPLSAPAISDEESAVPPGESLYFGVVGRQQVWRFYSATQAGIPDVRNWFPQEMNDLVYGVDYGPRPDRDEDTDEDAYVEYEDGDAVLLGWQGLASLSLIVSPHPDDTGSAEIVVTTDWAAPLETPIFGTPVPTATHYYDETGGVQLVSITDGHDGDTSGTVDITDELTGLDEFALLARTTGNPLVVLDGGDYSRTWVANHTIDVRALILYPRFRYWIPGILPLRQYPRNDGLKGGAPRAKATSRQSSTARRTYL